MFQRILVPLDGSTLAEQALPTAGRLARASGGTVILLRVISPPTEYANGSTYMIATPTDMLEQVIEADFADAQLYLEQVSTFPALAGVNTQIEVYMGVATPIILSLTAQQNIDVIVMSSHGRTGLKRWVLGSVAQKIVRLAPVPVLVLRDQGLVATGSHPYSERPLRILVPLDGSVVAKAALTPAIEMVTALASSGSAALHLLRVVKPATSPKGMDEHEVKKQLLHKARTYLQAVAGHVQDELKTKPEVAVTWSVALDTDVATAIIRVAENGEDTEGAGAFGGCDVIALSTHGRGSFQRWVMGSVAERVLEGTRLPVLMVHPQQVNTQQGASEEGIVQAGTRM